ncbi:hypothetical protein [Curtobacterium sp. MCSS17_016]|uniref:hypothetical protein n=1 Tax=Curtobacterium sp. MCSS17_016 TaxID=2175644 RepID=UPI000DA8DDD2|nr:hypothetical protein [Curtobacterium sp. MCSS17_016]WIE81136.1 hypothetical protein DEJ19_021915 [Curtobacterium sp. MCSS17_016]
MLTPTLDHATIVAAAKEVAAATLRRETDASVQLNDLPVAVLEQYLSDAEQSIYAALPVLWDAAGEVASKQAAAAIAAHAGGHPTAGGKTLAEYVTDRLSAVFTDEPIVE